MNRKFKFITVTLFTLCFGGCASTSEKGLVDDFIDGAVSNQQQRQEQQATGGSVPDNKFEEDDAVMGIFNVLLQGLVGLFSSDKTD